MRNLGLIEILFKDVEGSRYSHREWKGASETMLFKLERMMKEPQQMIFFKKTLLRLFLFKKINSATHS